MATTYTRPGCTAIGLAKLLRQMLESKSAMPLNTPTLDEGKFNIEKTIHYLEQHPDSAIDLSSIIELMESITKYFPFIKSLKEIPEETGLGFYHH